MIASAIVAGLFLKDYRQVPYSWFITVIWLAAGFLSIAFGIFYFAQFVLPHHEGESWLEGVAMVLEGAAWFRPPSSPTKVGPKFPGEENLPPSFNSLGAGILSSHQVLVTRKGTRFVRVAGPGFVRLKSGESIAQVVDLRKHVRSQDVNAITRDGITIGTNVRIVFQIKQLEQNQTQDRLEYPCDTTAVFKVSKASSVDAQHEILPWPEQIAPQAASYLISEVAQYTLDQLSQDATQFKDIRQSIRRQLTGKFYGMGIEIVDVAVSIRELPEEIVQQRLANWRAPWQSQVRAQIAASDANALRRMKLARAQAQVEIIQKIVQNIEEMRHSEEAELPQIVNLRMVEALGEAASDYSLKTTIPGQVLADMAIETSSLLDSLVTPPAEEEASDN
ncbi:MAG: hypothetical protein GWP61_21000 [Chloroflexi bacterium]|jgi:hypothetical protein|nr:hypothetical protein [Chloroflexota bacterium]